MIQINVNVANRVPLPHASVRRTFHSIAMSSRRFILQYRSDLDTRDIHGPPDAHFETLKKRCTGKSSWELTFVPCVRGTKTTSKRPYSDAQRNGVTWTPLHRASEKRLLNFCKFVGSSLMLHRRGSPRPSNLGRV